jgi:ribA/ribD-fused uncharacterized protein
MKTTLIAKFSQNKILLKKLFETGNKTLIEHTKNDKYWGDGGFGNGKNMLGKLLGEVRDELKGMES